MFIQNYAFLGIIFAVLWAGLSLWLKTPIEELAKSNPAWKIAYVLIPCGVFIVVYAVNLVFIFVYAKREVSTLVEARWRESFASSLESREAVHPYGSLLDHAAALRVKIHRLTYAFALWDLDIGDGER